MNVEIGAEAAQFPEKEDINGIVVAVLAKLLYHPYTFLSLWVGRHNMPGIHQNARNAPRISSFSFSYFTF
jgi:hypothetical protein